MDLKLCPKCQKPYLESQEYCPRCPRDPWEGKEESYGSLGCIVISIMALIGMMIFWVVLFLSFFIH
jgi:hypothetical protein